MSNKCGKSLCERVENLVAGDATIDELKARFDEAAQFLSCSPDEVMKRAMDLADSFFQHIAVERLDCVESTTRSARMLAYFVPITLPDLQSVIAMSTYRDTFDDVRRVRFWWFFAAYTVWPVMVLMYLQYGDVLLGVLIPVTLHYVASLAYIGATVAVGIYLGVRLEKYNNILATQENFGRISEQVYGELSQLKNVHSDLYPNMI